MTIALLLIVASSASAQERRSGFTLAADLHFDVTHITDFTPRGWSNPTNGLGNRGEGGGAANRVGFGAEIEYEKPSRRAWIASVGFAEGWLHYRQNPQLSPYGHHHIKYFDTYAVAVGTRQYLKSQENRVRAFGDVSVGYEHLAADLFYHNTVTDTVVHTGGPMARVRASWNGSSGQCWRAKPRRSTP